jgi:hypothetical protein
MRTVAIAALASLLALAPGEGAMAHEQPEYTVESEHEGFEIRRYPPYLVAETRVEGEFGDAGGEAFRILAGFISGKNRSRAKIAMTSPVTNEPAPSEKIAMTSPVVQEPAAPPDDGGAGWLYRFVMPSEYTRETLPEPTDPRIAIREMPERRVAVRRFRGFWSEENFEKNDAKLRAALPGAGLEPAGETLYARYDPPFTPWFLRRNEVWVELRPARAFP